MLTECVDWYAGLVYVFQLTLIFFQSFDDLVDEILASRVDAGNVEIRKRQRRDLIFNNLFYFY